MIIPQNEVDQAAIRHRIEGWGPNKNMDIYLDIENCEDDFKAGVEFAESKFEEILFGNGKGSLDDFLLNCEEISQEDREVAMEAISLYQIFLMEQDEL